MRERFDGRLTLTHLNHTMCEGYCGLRFPVSPRSLYSVLFHLRLMRLSPADIIRHTLSTTLSNAL